SGFYCLALHEALPNWDAALRGRPTARNGQRVGVRPAADREAERVVLALSGGDLGNGQGPRPERVRHGYGGRGAGLDRDGGARAVAGRAVGRTRVSCGNGADRNSTGPN